MLSRSGTNSGKCIQITWLPALEINCQRRAQIHQHFWLDLGLSPAMLARLHLFQTIPQLSSQLFRIALGINQLQSALRGLRTKLSQTVPIERNGQRR
jgi:hypothetical protein